MANIKSAKKQARQSEKRHLIKLDRRSSVRTVVRKLLVAMESGRDVAEVKSIFKAAEAGIARSKRKIMHPNAAARKVSRLAKRVAAYEASKA